MVVLDEVHYLQDTYRGPVWEEVIIHLPADVRLVCLSATVSNAEELADWISTVRGPTAAIIEERRPVKLENLYLVGDRTSDRLHLFPTLVDGRPNPEAARLDDEARPRLARRRTSASGRGRKLFTPRRVEVVERLDAEGMLPAIYFIFSRNACDEAAQTCLDAGLRLTAGPERDRIREIVDEHLGALDDHDLAVLGYGRFLAALENGIAAHHAGMVPPFKEAVEHCFVEGLVKVVFATETLALGINMPARSVVDREADEVHRRAPRVPDAGRLHPAHRAGRAARHRHPRVTRSCCGARSCRSSRSPRWPRAARSTCDRRSGRPTTWPPTSCGPTARERAHHLLNLSFAQYQADRDVVRLEARLARREAGARRAAARRREPVRRHRGVPPAHGAGGSPSGDDPNQRDIDAALARLRPGDVIVVRQGRHRDRVAVLAVAHRKGGLRVRGITPNRTQLLLGPGDFDEPPKPVGRLELPVPFTPNRQGFQREVAKQLERAKLAPLPKRPDHAAAAERDAVADHPVTDDPDLQGPAEGGRPGRAGGAGGGRPPQPGRRAQRVARPGASTASCGCSRPGATSTAGR